jgi:hypothetical protein|tara:strand:- start:286 stop:540 length:255 start_codon:yes stop_codon:yes gene_type:complete
MEKDEEAPLLPNHEEEQKNPDAKEEYSAGIRCLAMTALVCHSMCQLLVAIISFLLPIVVIVLLVYQIYQILDEIPDVLKKWGFK